jgi:hypothetical protein
MKISEFRKLIREEVRKVISEQRGTINNVKVYTLSTDLMSPLEFKKAFGSFLTIKQGPTNSQNQAEYTVDLSVDTLVNLLKSNKNFEVQSDNTNVEVYYKGDDQMTIKSKSLPANVVSTLKAFEKGFEKRNLVTVQISDPMDDFMAPEDYSIPTAVLAAVGKPTFSSAAGDSTNVYEKEIHKYIKKVEAALLAAGQKMVPGLKKYTI